MKTSVLLLVYIKPETTLKVIDRLREIRPSKMYISINIPPKKNKLELKKNREVINIINSIDWKCQVFKKKRSKHVSAYRSYKEAIDWFFLNEREGIILEDDTLPNKSFFNFCEKMLRTYRYNKKISQICGSSFINESDYKEKYFFSNYTLCWGYATWRRSIKDYDEHMKKWPILKQKNYLEKIIKDKKFVSYWTDIFDEQYSKKFQAWDYRWLYSNWSKGKISIIPKKHLIKNIGFVPGATHTKVKYKDWYNKMDTMEFDDNFFRKKIIKINYNYDRWLGKNIFRIEKTFLKKIIKNKLNTLNKFRFKFV